MLRDTRLSRNLTQEVSHLKLNLGNLTHEVSHLKLNLGIYHTCVVKAKRCLVMALITWIF